MRSASRTGSRLVPSRAATSSCRIHSPGRDLAGEDRVAQVRGDALAGGAGRPAVGDGSRHAKRRSGVAAKSNALPLGIADQLELHPPGREEVDPALALVGALLAVGSPSTRDALLAQVGDRRVEVVDVERDVVAADVAVARRHG